MKNTQNVTLSIPKDVLRKAKILAVKRNTSLSGLLTQALIELVTRQEAYELARRHNISVLKSGFDMGTVGQAAWKRDNLHDR